MSKNGKIAKIFHEIAFILEMEDDSLESNTVFKARSYNRAADVIENLSIELEEIYEKEKLKGLLRIPSIGNAIAAKIEEYIITGRIDYYERLKNRISIDVSQFIGLDGLGPKTIKIIQDNLHIKNLSDLEKLALEGKISNIPGFSQKKQELIVKKIELWKKGSKRHLIGAIYPLVKQIEKRLSDIDGVGKAIAVGSFRRMKETIGDIDYLVSLSNNKKSLAQDIIEFFVNMPEVKEVLSKGSSKAFVKLNNGIDADILVVPSESFGTALQYFTGSKEHNIALRKIAMSKNLRLNEWGIFDKDNNQIGGSTEEKIYQILNLEWIAPEMRESKGEIELAKMGKASKLPTLITYNDLKGDLQVHSNSTDGTMSIDQMAAYAKDKLCLDYIAISDHTKSLHIANGLDERQLLDQAYRIGEINDKINSNAENNNKKKKKFHILTSAEVNILKDGSLDISNNVLDKLDIVGAAIHSNFQLPIEIQTERLVKAAQNPSVDIIFHPTGRIINKRDGYPVDISKLIEVAKDTSTVLEIDVHYDRLDLKDEYIKMAIENEVKLVIDSDAHHPLHFAFLRFGIGQARRGWAKRSDILNTLSDKELLYNIK